MSEEAKKAVIEYLEKLKKSKVYFNDLEKAVKSKIPDMKTREVKKVLTELINEGTLIYYSTGSTTMYGLKGKGITTDTPDLEE
ncbi:MAG TPA: sulfite reductase [Desulfotomaculum sp.]|nr:sulfite reductase [Desulfotomaculum sp.]